MGLFTAPTTDFDLLYERSVADKGYRAHYAPPDHRFMVAILGGLHSHYVRV